MLTLALKHFFRGPELIKDMCVHPWADWEHCWIFYPELEHQRGLWPGTWAQAVTLPGPDVDRRRTASLQPKNQGE